METRQEDSIQQLLLQMRQEHADELRRMEESREADLRMMRDRFEDLILRQETGRTRGSQDLAGGRTNSGGSLGGGPTTAGDGIPNMDPQVAVQAVDTQPIRPVVSVQHEWSKHHPRFFLVVRKIGGALRTTSPRSHSTMVLHTC